MTPAAATTDPADPADPADTDLPACCICLQACSSSSSSTHTLECGHVFHTDCIIAWFRTRGNAGTCPMCRAPPTEILTYPDAYARCSMLRRRARAAGAPAMLKRAVARIQKAEQKEKDAAHESKEFLTADTRQILQTYRPDVVPSQVSKHHSFRSMAPTSTGWKYTNGDALVLPVPDTTPVKNPKSYRFRNIKPTQVSLPRPCPAACA